MKSDHRTTRKIISFMAILTCLASAGQAAEDATATEDGGTPNRPWRERRVGPGMNNPGIRRGEGQPGGQPGKKFDLETLAQHLSPEELEELRLLRQENPREFRQRVHDLYRQLRQERGDHEGRRHLRELRAAFLAAEDDADREAIRAQIVAAVKAEFAEQMEVGRRRLAESRARLAEIEQKFAEREQQAEQLVAERVRNLTADKRPGPQDTTVP